MKVVDPGLRLSAQRALLGAISPAIRLIKVNRDGDRITVTAIVAEPLSETASDALSTAATEIVADYKDCFIHEVMIVSKAPLPRESFLEEGWVYCRYEGK